jgi:hypothetical protein
MCRKELVHHHNGCSGIGFNSPDEPHENPHISVPLINQGPFLIYIDRPVQGRLGAFFALYLFPQRLRHTALPTTGVSLGATAGGKGRDRH